MIRTLFVFIFIATLLSGYAQDSMSEAKADELTIVDFEGMQDYLKDIDADLLVVNFWATWCKPCIQEMPFFEAVSKKHAAEEVRVVLVSLDFEQQIEKKLIPYLNENEIQSDVIVLDDPQTSMWIDKVSTDWSGAIPATWLISRNGKQAFHEGMFPDQQSLDTFLFTLKNQ